MGRQARFTPLHTSIEVAYPSRGSRSMYSTVTVRQETCYDEGKQTISVARNGAIVLIQKQLK